MADITDIQSFYDRISGEINRGTALDSLVPDKVQDAINWFERLRNWEHMRKFVTFEIDPDEDYPRTVTMPIGFKSMIFWRLVISASDIRYLNQVDPETVKKREDDEYPTGYWQDGLEYFWLDNVPASTVDCEMAYIEKTILSSDTSVTAPKILTEFTECILPITMVLFGPKLRDSKLLQLYQTQREDTMKAATLEDDERKENNRDEAQTYDGSRFG